MTTRDAVRIMKRSGNVSEIMRRSAVKTRFRIRLTCSERKRWNPQIRKGMSPTESVKSNWSLIEIVIPAGADVYTHAPGGILQLKLARTAVRTVYPRLTFTAHIGVFIVTHEYRTNRRLFFNRLSRFIKILRTENLNASQVLVLRS